MWGQVLVFNFRSFDQALKCLPAVRKLRQFENLKFPPKKPINLYI